MIYLIITTSTVINRHTIETYERRKNNYLNSITNTLNNCDRTKITPIIVENNKTENQDKYLSNFNGVDVFYTDNNLKLKDVVHKGWIELYDIKDVINHYDIKDDDIVIKITGRYYLNSSIFLDYVYDNQNNYDAFIKFWNVCANEFQENDCALGMIAMRCKLFKEFNYDVEMLSPECDLARHIRNLQKQEKIRLAEIKLLDLVCLFAQSSYASHI